MPVSAESFVWPEGNATLWTGGGAASAVVGLAQGSNVAFARGWLNVEMTTARNTDILTGQRVEVSVDAVYMTDDSVMILFNGETATHMKFVHDNVNGSAGYFLYSGVLDAVRYNGTENAPFRYSLTYHANSWSAF